jgi:hypothetical protein
MDFPVSLGRAAHGAALGVLFAGALCAQSATVTDVFVLPDIQLGVFQNTYLPGTVDNDHGFKLGGIGSGVWKGPGDGPGIFWMITDRGPNPQTPAPIKRAFPVATFTPFILQVKAEQGTISILKAIPLVGNNGAGVSGLPNNPLAASPASPNALGDEQPYNCDISATINGNPDGHDTEDLVRDIRGTFWTVDEYGPSISKIDATGVVLTRFVPKGRKAVSGDHFAVVDNLPEILGRRPRNRGFEGLALTPNNRTLMAVVQSPLTNPSTAVGNPSRAIRLIGFDTQSESPVAEYVYVMQPVTEFGHTNPTEMKISAITALDERRFLVLERTDAVAKIYRIDLKDATNILGSKWDDSATTPSLEALAEFTDVRPVTKELVLDLSTLGDVIPPKIEGLTVLDDYTIMVSNDNDFQVGPPTCDVNVPPTTPPAESRLMVIKLANSVK